jgi:dinuclear metal center YbgI/SA1388 family protein
MTCTVRHIYDWVDAFAPFATAQEHDNVGLLTGRFDAPVTRVLTALDCTLAVVREALALKAEVILTHHPLMFHPRRHLREEGEEARVLCALIRGNLSLLCAHTNLDRAPGGINDVLAGLFSLGDIRGEGFLRCGRLEKPRSAGALQELSARVLKAPVRLYGPPEHPVDTLGVAGGAYGEGWAEAAALGAQAFLTGEVRHHEALAALGEGVVLLEAGHYATEAPGLRALGDCLQTGRDTLQYPVAVSHASAASYPGALKA